MLRLLPAISSLLISTLLVHSPAFFPKPLLIFFPVLALANTGSCVGTENKKKKVILLDAGSRVECSWNINRLKKNMTCGMMICEMNNSEIE